MPIERLDHLLRLRVVAAIDVDVAAVAVAEQEKKEVVGERFDRPRSSCQSKNQLDRAIYTGASNRPDLGGY